MSIAIKLNKYLNSFFKLDLKEVDKEIKQNWSLVLPLVQRIHNATPHSSTQVAPSQLIFNNNIRFFYSGKGYN